MKKIFLIALLAIGWGACKKSGPPAAGNGTDTRAVLSVSAPEQGFIYLDGAYTGIKAPGKISASRGKHMIGIALQPSFQYLRKEINVGADSTISLTAADAPAAKTWKALWIGVNETTGTTPGGQCSTHFTVKELDEAYSFFEWSIREHMEKYTYHTIHWEVERKDIVVPVTLTESGSGRYTAEPGTISGLLPQIQPGVYDCVFVFWREKEGTCNFSSNYFGLAWTNPMSENIKTGYVTVKFDAANSVTERINYYKTNDPGVWIHEWLHTVGENFYQSRGKQLPRKAGDGLVVHAAEMYNYKFPWMDWYQDFIAGRVVNVYDGPKYLGIGPEAFLNCSLREAAVNNCH